MLEVFTWRMRYLLGRSHFWHHVKEWSPEISVSSKIVFNQYELKRAKGYKCKRHECSYIACHARRTLTDKLTTKVFQGSTITACSFLYLATACYCRLCARFQCRWCVHGLSTLINGTTLSWYSLSRFAAFCKEKSKFLT